MNPLFGNVQVTQGIAQQPKLPAQAVEQVRGMIQNLETLQNPMQAIQRVAGQNPMLNMVMGMVSGRNPQQVYYEECQKVGVDPNIIINALNGR